MLKIKFLLSIENDLVKTIQCRFSFFINAKRSPIFNLWFTKGDTLADFQFVVYKRARLPPIFSMGFTKGETLAIFQLWFYKGRNGRRFSNKKALNLFPSRIDPPKDFTRFLPVFRIKIKNHMKWARGPILYYRLGYGQGLFTDGF